MRKYHETTSCLSLVLAAGLMVGTSSLAWANPEGGVVATGSATITSPTANKLDVHQSSQNVVIDWRSFDIAPNEHTQFYQPNSSATALNRISSGNASQILGKLSANGNVMIVNQAGIVFGKDAVVDVNGLVGTTADITNNNFMNGNLTFDKAGNPSAKIINKGTITAKDAGLVGLVAPSVTNSGTITAKVGKVQLASGDKFSVDMYGDGLMNITLSDDVSTQLIENSGTIKAEGGTVELTAAAGANVVNSLVNISGEILAPSITNKDGKITISSEGSISHTGTLDASSHVAGTKAGTITVKANKIAQQGKITANSTSTGTAGSINIDFKTSYLDNEASTTSVKGTTTKGGTIKVTGGTGSRAFVSGNYNVSSTNNTGGTATITTDMGDLKLFGAHVTADGQTGGGTINIGGEYQGTGTTIHSSKTGINYATYLSANATGSGNGGNVIVWSDDLTQFAGHASAKGGTTSGNGGLIELSSKDTLQVTQNADTNASATYGTAGSLLLDPKNIIVATGGITGGISSFEFIDPDPDSGEFAVYGEKAISVGNNNFLIGDPSDDTMATNGGAVYIYNAATGGLISSLYGASAGDKIGYDSGSPNAYQATGLANGNVVLSSRTWDNVALGVTDAGAITFINGTTGLSGIVSASNSLVGGHTGDFDFSMATQVMTLSNGNYIITNPLWDSATATDVGAVTWGDGTTGISGLINSTNSYIGSTSGDKIGGSGIGTYVLGNDNYVISSPDWDNVGFGAVDAGAFTWGNGATGSSGIIDATNSVVGSHAFDNVGSSIITLQDGSNNYLALSDMWNNYAGMVYVGDGNSATSGILSSANAVVGSSANDRIGLMYNGGQYQLTNGKIVVGSSSWDNPLTSTANVGAVRIINPNHASANGYLNASNSLIGTHADDQVGYFTSVFDLGNGAIVITSYLWDNGTINDAGAATWMDTNSPLVGEISVTNSLVGTSANDMVGLGGATVLSNNNYVVSSQEWDNGSVQNAGAITWGNGTTGITGAVSTSNSLYGTTDFDEVGRNGIYELGTSGNYYAISHSWDGSGNVDVGAMTWGDGSTGSSGAVDSSNSIVGTETGDLNWPVVTCNNLGTCLINFAEWDGGSLQDAGAVRLVSQNGFSGTINSANSLLGTHQNDTMGSGTVVLTNGNYIAYFTEWNSGLGALTWIDGTSGLTGNINSSNSLVGTTAGDFYGISLDTGGTIPSNYYALSLSTFDNGPISDAGAFGLLSTTGPITGTIDNTRFIVGNASGDISTGITFLSATTGFMVNRDYDHGVDIDIGAVTYFDLANAPLVGALDESQSIFLKYDGQEDTVNNRYIGYIANGSEQRVISFSFGATLGDSDSYSDQSSSTITLDPTFITNVLNGGTAVTLQASNDITINDAIIANNGGGNGGTLTLQAGRSILINDDIFTDDGDLNIFANEKLSTGVVNAHRDAGAAVITMANGTTLDAGTGDVYIRLDDGAGKTNLGAGSITLRTVNGNTITAENKNTSGDIILANGSGLTASAATGDSIILASRRSFINNIGVSALNLSGAARWLSYSTRDTSDTIGGLSPAFTLFNCTYGASCGALPAGNGFLYSFDPNAPIVTPTNSATGLPPTVLYVSQTPPFNIINKPQNAVSTQQTASGKTVITASNTGTAPDYLATAPQDIVDNQPYSLFNGWITISPELVRKLNLLRVRI